MMSKLFTSEGFYANLVFAPIVALGLVFGYGFMQRTTDSTWCNNRLLELRDAGFPIDDRSLSQSVQASTSPEHTDELLLMLSAQKSFSSSGLSMKLPDSDELVGKDETWEAAAFMAETSSDRSVVVKKINAIGELNQAIWVPVHFNAFNSMLPEYQQSRSLIRRCQEQFRHHFHEGDHEAAIDDLQAMDRIRKQIGKLPYAVVYLIDIAFLDVLHQTIGESLAMDQWSEAELEQIRDFVDQSIIGEYDWPMVVYGEQAAVLETLGIHPGAIGSMSSRVHSGLSQGMAPVGISPVHLRSFLECGDDLATLENVGEDGFASTIDEAMEKHGYKNRKTLDEVVIVGGPFASQYAIDYLMSAWQAIGGAITRAEMTRKATLSAIAIKQYQLTQNEWPEKLSDLKSVGLTSADYRHNSRSDFGYQRAQQRDEGVWLWTPGWIRSPANPGGTWDTSTVPDDVIAGENDRTAFQIR